MFNGIIVDAFPDNFSALFRFNVEVRMDDTRSRLSLESTPSPHGLLIRGMIRIALSNYLRKCMKEQTNIGQSVYWMSLGEEDIDIFQDLTGSIFVNYRLQVKDLDIWRSLTQLKRFQYEML